MASSKQAQRIYSQGRKIVTSATNKRPRSVPQIDANVEDSGDSQDESSQQTNVGQSGRQKKQQKAVRPNAFLSFRITNQQIIDQASEIQQQIIESNPLLSKASISIPTLHITLMVFSLKTDDDKEKLV